MPKGATGGGWHVYCRVVDNLGDAGVCWRLARQLARTHGLDVTLWIDRPEVLARLVPALASRDSAGAPPEFPESPGSPAADGVKVRAWTDDMPPLPSDAAVVVAAFGADLPPAVRRSMRERPRPPAWINLEYLSAEAWVDSHHGLPSPKPDGLVEHFFFPGPGPGTGGMLREPELLPARDRFLTEAGARTAWLASIGVDRSPDERLLSLFCYPHAAGDRLLSALRASGGRWRVLLPEGVHARGIGPAHAARPSLRASGVAGRDPVVVQPVPFLPQQDYDRLLWACDANLVRGEDSLVRALWSGRPFLWQAYPQQQAVHLVKVRALVQRWLDAAQPGDAAADAFMRAHGSWNAEGVGGDAAPERGVATESSCEDALQAWLRELPALRAAAARWSAAHGSPGTDLASRLVGFANMLAASDRI